MKLYMKILCAIFLLSNTLFSKGIPAGTQIINTAQLNYNINGTDFNTTSNTLVDVVDQVLDLEIVCQSAQNVVVQNGELKRALPFVLENIGNGTDNFTLLPDTNASSPEVDNRLIYLDDGDGVFNSADVQVNDINLTADAKATLFFVSDIPASATWHTSNNGIEARSTIGGSGIPGSAYTLSNYAAVDGYKGGVDSALCIYERSQLELTLVKSSTLSSPELFTGTIIHYKIIASMVGVGTLTNVTLKDVIPAGTTYVNNSLLLDTVSMSDAGHIAGTTISVPVGDMTQTNTTQPIHTLEFDVSVN
jgi:uncharacterized repeat protein (TIGR01451 family)